MPLNYNKWDALELSDDSDFEGHPNVDKKSFILWKQRDIHQKREMRKTTIANLQRSIEANTALRAKLGDVAREVEGAGGVAYFKSLLEEVQARVKDGGSGPGTDDADDSDGEHDAPPALPPSESPAEQQASAEDQFLLTDLQKVQEQINGHEDAGSICDAIKAINAEWKSKCDEMQKQLDSEIKEQSKKITSDDLHVGVNSTYTAPPPKPTSTEKPKTKKRTETSIETLNPGVTPRPLDAEEEEELDDIAEMTDVSRGFSRIPMGDFEKSFKFIQDHPEINSVRSTDAILMEAFAAQRKSNPVYAKQCIHQGLLLQYIQKLGKDGVGLFFKRMLSGDRQPLLVFQKDVDDTYGHVVRRVEETKNEVPVDNASREQIQLVQEDASHPITFNTPEGPPPEEIKLEGPGTEDLDIEQVRRALQLRWDIFKTFDAKMQEALQRGSLEEVNQVLGSMDVAQAEEVVKLLEMAGILSFADGGKVRDETGGDDETGDSSVAQA